MGSRHAAFALASLLAAACQRERAPTPAPISTADTAPSAIPSATVAAPPPAASTAAPPAGSAEEDAGRVAPVGGNWLRCYASFQPRTRPELDVMRLGLLCGPSNGMKKVADAPLAPIGSGGAGREHRFAAHAGDCFRVFAVADPGVEDLDVEVLDPSGARVAFDTSDDRWPIVAPDGPFCVFKDGEYRAVVRAQRGSGRYAAEIWRLH
jgi:hypothetical protein